ncbi:hypothetical protein LZ023_40565 (plasmid) [Pseudomonas silvicola]|nr:hypothetical protein LZ023_40565 [Pseudomonas silvicola]
MTSDMHFWLTTLVIAITILLWASARLPEYLTALLFFAAATLLNIAPTSTISSADLPLQPSLAGIERFCARCGDPQSRAAQRWANYLVVPLSQSWPRMVVGTLVLTYLLALVMPSNMGRIALLMPVVLALGERAGIKAGEQWQHWSGAGGGFWAHSSPPASYRLMCPIWCSSGAAENAYQIHLQWLPWWLPYGGGDWQGMALAAAILFVPRATQPVRHRDQL